MLELTVRLRVTALMAAALLSACASTQSAGPSRLGPAALTSGVEIDIDGALPLVDTRSDPLLAGRVGIGDESAALRYHATYMLEPGDVFAGQTAAPKRFGGQRFGQELRMRLPAVAGSPLALKFRAETRDVWQTDRGIVEQQRQLAKLEWSPGLARLDLQWGTGGAMADSQLALDCALRGTLQMSLPNGSAAAGPAMRVTGRDCLVRTSDPRYSELAAATWGVALAWRSTEYETELLFSVIDPGVGEATLRQEIEASYQFGLSHRRAHGDWSTEGLVAMRYAPSWDLARLREAGAYASDTDAYWMAKMSLTRHLPAVSLSANWSHSADPMWFMPDIGEQKHRLDVRLDLSRLLAAVAPEVNPQLSMQWNWHEARSRADAVTGDNAIKLNMAVAW
ncbi:hypothetical protein [Thioalkalivibrio sp. XN279]|uniref:hypothetical protein n=1 Tax=Thioalkalivibrio sp. XN279 TaxID=2714953 RepID=UPI00140B6DB3|nr:hypothetical protein [Thioalkalivibrio sp. XN279]NHA15433.1 hypothetical protein [Thioalkalivibrio sp. XN279]